MKHKAPQEPKPFRAFRDKYLAAIMMVAALLITSVVSAQLDSAKYSRINGYGFGYKRMVFDSVLMIPRSTSPHVPYRAGAIRYNTPDSTLQLWTGNQWMSIVTGVGNGVDTAYAYDDSTIAIETPDENFFITLPGRYWNLQGILNNGSTLTENENIVLADSLEFTSGVVVVESIRLRNITSSVDTTTYKPVAVGPNGTTVKLSGWPGAGTPTVDTIQVHTSGTTITVSTGVNILYIDPASTLATLTITLPATPNHTGTLDIYFGGTVTSGNVVTAITISPNSGQTKLEASTPGYVEAGEHISYQYRSSNTKWYRKY